MSNFHVTILTKEVLEIERKNERFRNESRAESQLEKVVTLNPAEISDFPNHPFKVKQDEEWLKWSIVSENTAC